MNRCKCKTLKGDQCTKKTIDGIYCGIHKKKCRYDFGQQENNTAQRNNTILENEIIKLKKINNDLHTDMQANEHRITYCTSQLEDCNLLRLKQINECKKEKNHILGNFKHMREKPNRRMVQLDEDGGMFDLFEKKTPSLPHKTAFPFSKNISKFMNNIYSRSSFCG